MAYNVNAQIFLNRSEQEEFLYIYEKKDGKESLLDSIATLNIFSEYSYAESNGFIYIVWSAIAEDGKVYYINVYSINNRNKANLNAQYWIEQSKYKNLFEKGLRVEITPKGLKLSFDRGKIVQMILGFKEMDFDALPKELSKISKW